MLFMNKEEKILNKFYEFCSTTGGEKRLKKIKIIMRKTKPMIKKDFTKLKIDDVVKYLSFINNSNYSLHSKNDYKKVFKRFLKWYYKDLEMIEGEVVKLGFKLASDKAVRNKNKINKNTLVKPDELEKLIRTANSLKWKALISLLYEGALRPCEIRVLKWKDINFDDSMNLCRVYIISPKTKDTREVCVRDSIIHLKRWEKEYSFSNKTNEDYVFPSQHFQNKPMGEGVITEMFKRLCIKAKIRNIFAYLLRHTRIYEIQKKLPEKLASKFAGHSSKNSEFYNHLDDDDVEESMLKLFYPIKEITKEDKNEYEQKIEKLEKSQEAITPYLEVLKLMSKDYNQFKKLHPEKDVAIDFSVKYVEKKMNSNKI